MKQKKNYYPLGSIMILEANKNEYQIQIFENKYSESYICQDVPPPIEQLLQETKGDVEVLLLSDIFDVESLSYKIRNLEPHTLIRLQNNLLDGVLPFLATKSWEIGNSIMIQSQYDANESSLLISASFLNDLPVVLIRIEKKKEEIVF